MYMYIITHVHVDNYTCYNYTCTHVHNYTCI